jgi:hypothetical protein
MTKPVYLASLCFCALLLGCSEPKDSSRVVYCKVVVNAFAFNPSDMDYVKVEELTLPSGPQVDILFDDFNEYGARERRRVTCDFDEIELMTKVVVDGRELIYEEVRNLNVEAFIFDTERMIEDIRASRRSPFSRVQ